MSNTLSAAPSLDDAQALRQASADWLSLALMDARNCTLRRLAMFEDAQALAPRESVSPLWLAGHGAWFQEYWVARHAQRTRGELAAPDGARLASIEPRADDWFGGATQDCLGLDAPALRAYLAATLETTLELLETAADNDQGLYFYRMALMHEDRLCETLAELAMTWQLKVNKELGAPPPRVDREALRMPGQRFMLGSFKTSQKTAAPSGLVPDNERWAHEVVVPEFEIDAQAVNWACYVQFAEDGGYDDPAHWSDEGWHWLSRQARRAPRNVEQMRGGVLVMRHGAMQRAPAGQAVMHITAMKRRPGAPGLGGACPPSPSGSWRPVRRPPAVLCGATFLSGWLAAPRPGPATAHCRAPRQTSWTSCPPPARKACFGVALGSPANVCCTPRRGDFQPLNATARSAVFAAAPCNFKRATQGLAS